MPYRYKSTIYESAWIIKYRVIAGGEWSFVEINEAAKLENWPCIPGFCEGLKIATWKTRKKAREFIISSRMESRFKSVQAIYTHVTIEEL